MLPSAAATATAAAAISHTNTPRSSVLANIAAVNMGVEPPPSELRVDVGTVFNEELPDLKVATKAPCMERSVWVRAYFRQVGDDLGPSPKVKKL